MLGSHAPFRPSRKVLPDASVHLQYTEIVMPRTGCTMLATSGVRKTLMHPAHILRGIPDERLVERAANGAGAEQHGRYICFEMINHTFNRIILGDHGGTKK